MFPPSPSIILHFIISNRLMAAAATAPTADGGNRLRYVEFTPSIEVTVWFEVERRKLVDWKLDEPRVVINGSMLHPAFRGPLKANHLASVVQLDKESFAPVPAATSPAAAGAALTTAHRVALPMTLLNFNTAQQLIDFNRAKEFDSVKALFLAAVQDGSWTSTRPLVHGLLFTFADLKVHTFSYAIGFPAIDLGASPVTLVRPAVSLASLGVSTSDMERIVSFPSTLAAPLAPFQAVFDRATHALLRVESLDVAACMATAAPTADDAVVTYVCPAAQPKALPRWLTSCAATPVLSASSRHPQVGALFASGRQFRLTSRWHLCNMAAGRWRNPVNGGRLTRGNQRRKPPALCWPPASISMHRSRRASSAIEEGRSNNDPLIGVVIVLMGVARRRVVPSLSSGLPPTVTSMRHACRKGTAPCDAPSGQTSLTVWVALLIILPRSTRARRERCTVPGVPNPAPTIEKFIFVVLSFPH